MMKATRPIPFLLLFLLSFFLLFSPAMSDNPDYRVIGKFLLLFLPVVVMPLFVLLVRAVRWIWTYFQPQNEYGEKPISDFHKKWRNGFSGFRFFMETSEFGKYWVFFWRFISCWLYCISSFSLSFSLSPFCS